VRHPDAEKTAFHEALGSSIRRHREAAGLSQRQVGEAVGTTGSAIDKYEDGATPAPSFVVWKLAHLFNVTTDELMVDPSGEVAALLLEAWRGAEEQAAEERARQDDERRERRRRKPRRAA
jgi:transcriptional regulator with XRE-family HTH domain